jgi:hypothetical protein
MTVADMRAVKGYDFLLKDQFHHTESTCYIRRNPREANKPSFGIRVNNKIRQQACFQTQYLGVIYQT